MEMEAERALAEDNDVHVDGLEISWRVWILIKGTETDEEVVAEELNLLARLLHERKAGGHRVLIFTQMTRILDILEMFLNYHGYLYLRLDGATKIEDRQYITERFNVDERIFAFIASSRSGGVGIKYVLYAHSFIPFSAF